jgi:hypothetical protein
MGAKTSEDDYNGGNGINPHNSLYMNQAYTFQAMDPSHPSHPPQAENHEVLISPVTETVLSEAKGVMTTTTMMISMPLPDR